ncbi:MAG: VIT domain-containing protein [Dehalococcoidia bacterium]|nr:VIT domain-containing protein [Dehalococcoidia bacterium]
MNTIARLLLILLVGLGTLAGPAGPAFAQGFEPPVGVTPVRPLPPQPPMPPIRMPVILPTPEVKYQRVEVSIDGQVATTRIDQLFVNTGSFPVEGVYLFPLPEDAAISSFDMYVDGQRWQGELLPKEKARQIYESIVRQQRDPALLEYVGRSAFQARIFPIPPKGERRIQLEYAQVLPADAGVAHYVYPLKSPRILPREVMEPGPCLGCAPQAFPLPPAPLIRELTIHATLKAAQPIKAIYSPSHEVAVTRASERQADVSYEASNARPDRDFDLYYSFAPGDIGLSLLTYREKGQDGFFLLLIAPPVDAPAKAVDKDVVFVLDISGSMQGQKMEQARAALEYVLDRLNPGDRFNIVVFNSAVSTYADALRPASERSQAVPFVRGLQAAGGTNIHDALQAALGMAPQGGGRPHVVIFLTDGLPTVGVTQPNAIIDGVAQASKKDVRLFTFGVGDDVNAFLLDTIAQRNRGVSDYIRPGQDIQEKLARFYEKTSTPVLTDLKLDTGVVKVEDVYPQPLPDLYAGNQLVVVGRYRSEVAAAIALKGLVNGQEKTYTYAGQSFPSESASAAFLPRLWATRKVGYLLNQIRLNGQSKELVDEVVALATRYAIATPFTSFLVREKDAGVTPPGTPRPLPAQGAPAPAPSLAPQSGAAAVQASQAIEGLRRAQVAGDASAQDQRVAGARVFLLRDGVWMDTSYRQGTPLTDVPFGSEGYFRLLDRYPEAAHYLSVGDRVIVMLGGAAYRVTAEVSSQPTGAATPTATPTATFTPAPTRTPSPTPTVAPTPRIPAGPPPASAAPGLLEVAVRWIADIFHSLFG